jgi:competence protein ComGC
MDFLREFVAFLRERKKYWLIPLLVILLLFSLLIVLTQGTALVPFIYSIF